MLNITVIYSVDSEIFHSRPKWWIDTCSYLNMVRCNEHSTPHQQGSLHALLLSHYLLVETNIYYLHYLLRIIVILYNQFVFLSVVPKVHVGKNEFT